MNKHMSMNSQPSIHSSNYSGQPYDAAGHANYGAYGAQHPPNNGQGPQVGPPNGQGHPPGPYGGPYNNMFDRQSSAASEYGAAASQHGAAPYGGPGGAHPPGYGAHPGAYGAAPVQPGAPYGTPAPYGASEKAESVAASSVAAAPAANFEPQMHGSIQDSVMPSAMHPAGAGSSMAGASASDPNQSSFSVQPSAMQPSAAAAMAHVEPTIPGGAVERTVDDTGMVPQGIDPSWQSNPEAPPAKLDANGRVVMGGAAAPEAGTGAPGTRSSHQEGVPHTATFTELNEGPQKNTGMMNLGNTTDARQGPFSANAASSIHDSIGAGAPVGPRLDGHNDAVGMRAPEAALGGTTPSLLACLP